jgi:hypothetical protein
MMSVPLEGPWPAGGVTLEYRWSTGAVLGAAILGVDYLGATTTPELEPPWSGTPPTLEPPW